jgi:hypothetical protein
MRRCMLGAFLAAAVVSTTGSLGRAAAVISTFDSGLEGWTFTSEGEISWEPSGGNPGGYIRFVDDPGVGARLVAPSKFLGDWSGLDGIGVISYDHAIFDVGVNPIFHPYNISISGPDGLAEWRGATPAGVTDWRTVEALLKESEWTVTEGAWPLLLANVTELRIAIEAVENLYIPGTPWSGDITGMDNVYLCAEHVRQLEGASPSDNVMEVKS